MVKIYVCTQMPLLTYKCPFLALPPPQTKLRSAAPACWCALVPWSKLTFSSRFFCLMKQFWFVLFYNEKQNKTRNRKTLCGCGMYANNSKKLKKWKISMCEIHQTSHQGNWLNLHIYCMKFRGANFTFQFND